LEWDENKKRENLQKHGFDFADASQLFNNPLLVKPDIRKAYGEDRWIGIGKMNNGFIVVFVFTKRKNKITRIISMRKASKKERKNYEKSIKNQLDKN
jgi:uncharacterized DUF497 family protein